MGLFEDIRIRRFRIPFWRRSYAYDRKTPILILVLVAIIIFFVYDFGDMSTSLKEINSKNTPLENSEVKQTDKNNSFLESIKEFFKGININLNSCPQLNYPMIDSQNGKYLPDNNYEGWFVTSERYLNQISNPLFSTFAFNVNPYKIICNKGNQKGENPNYWYCGETYVQYGTFEDNGYAVIIKTETNADGTIGDTIIKSFVNVYDEEGNFIKTTCGKAPDSLREQAFKDAIKEIDDFFSLG